MRESQASGVAPASQAPRRRAAFAAFAALALAASALAGCTSPGADPGAHGVTASAVVGPNPSAAPPDHSMTPVEAAPRCTSTRPLTGRGLLPVDAVFPGAESSASSAPAEVVPGADAADRARCPGRLPAQPLCDGLVPWTGLPSESFVPATAARRLVQGYLLTMPRLAGNQAPPESSAGTKAVTYALVDLPQADPAGLVDYLHVAFTACAKATSRTVAGVSTLVGRVRSEYGAGSAQVVLLRRGSRVVWASLDGSGWGPGEQQRAVAVLVARLL